MTVLIVALIGTACGGSPEVAWEGRVEPLETTGSRVLNPPRPMWQEASGWLRLELEQTYGVEAMPAEATLARVRAFAVDGAGSVYVLDSQDNRLVAFAVDGTLLWAAGREGEGPGELSRPRDVCLDGDRLYVLNRSGTSIDMWSVDGEYLDSRRLEDLDVSSSNRIGFVAPGALAVVGQGPVPVVSLFDIRNDWRRLDSYEIDAGGAYLPDSQSYARGGVRVLSGHIATGNAMEHVFRTYAWGGDLELEVRQDNESFVPAALDGERGAIASLGLVNPPLRLPQGYWLVQAHWPTNVEDPVAWLRAAFAGDDIALERRFVLDLFDSEGRWLASRRWDYPEVPDIGTLDAVGSDGRLYASVADPFPAVRRYRVDVAPPSLR